MGNENSGAKTISSIQTDEHWNCVDTFFVSVFGRFQFNFDYKLFKWKYWMNATQRPIDENK